MECRFSRPSPQRPLDWHEVSKTAGDSGPSQRKGSPYGPKVANPVLELSVPNVGTGCAGARRGWASLSPVSCSFQHEIQTQVTWERPSKEHQTGSQFNPSCMSPGRRESDTHSLIVNS